ncbi:hypothetical protein CIPAW_07G128100 [Carya illinoinensis]|uniref:Uncharacterized protein n=1 Tax=Carya illinoinensis TaxID=32201 RepID=A0A8T1Q534_CARIL|nr:hypothetical protein CIPAW_07G128100 [Carya illinoinensis]
MGCFSNVLPGVGTPKKARHDGISNNCNQLRLGMELTLSYVVYVESLERNSGQSGPIVASFNSPRNLRIFLTVFGY